MGGWLCSARAEACVRCGGSATLLALTRRCALCEAEAYDSAMMLAFPWFVPHGPRLREAVAGRVGEPGCG